MAKCSFEFNSHSWGQEHDVEIEEHWNWSCPYQALDNCNKCIFHLSPAQREANNVSGSDLREKFTEKVLRGKHNRLHGASFSEIDLSFLNLDNKGDQPINIMANSFEMLSFANAHISVTIRLTYAEINTLNLQHTVFNRPLDVQRSTIVDKIDGTMAKLERVYGADASIEKCEIQDAVIDRIGFRGANIGELDCSHSKLSVLLDGVTVTDNLNLENAEIQRGIQCFEASFHCDFDLDDVTIDGNVRLEGSDFYSDVNIKKSILDGIGLKGCEIHGEIYISDSEIGDLILDGAIYHNGITISGIEGDRIRMNKPTINGDLNLYQLTLDICYLREFETENVSISCDNVLEMKIFNLVTDHLHISEGRIDSLSFDGTTIELFSSVNANIGSLIQVDGENNDYIERNYWGKITFRKTDIDSLKWIGSPKCEASHIEFVGGSVEKGLLDQPNDGIFVYSFHGTKIGDIISNKPSGEKTKYIHFLKTEFDDFPFQEYSEDLSPNWELNQGPGINRRMFEQTPFDEYQTYQNARADAEKNNQEDARSGLYLREMEKRKEVLQTRAKENKDRNARFKLYEMRLLGWICGYGEKPGKPILWASGIIFSFGFIFSILRFLDEKSATESLVSGFTLSLQSFATLVFGINTEMTSPLLRFLTSVEGALSTLLIPFLVFSLTKSID